MTNLINNQALDIAIQVIMWVAVILEILILLPAMIKILRTKNTVSYSLWMTIIYPLSNLIWPIYTIMLFVQYNDTIAKFIGNLVLNAIGLCLSLFILITKLIHIFKAKKMNLTEEEWYYNVYLKNKTKIVVEYTTNFSKKELIKIYCFLNNSLQTQEINKLSKYELCLKIKELLNKDQEK